MINKDDIYFLNTNKSVRIKNLIFLNIKKVNLSSGGFSTEATFEVNEEDRLSWSQLMPEFQKNGSIDDLITEHLDRMKSDDESIMIFITSIKPSKRRNFKVCLIWAIMTNYNCHLLLYRSLKKFLKERYFIKEFN